MSFASYKRSDRVGDLIKKELAGIILSDINDPRIGFVTITKVSMSPDLRQAKVYFSVMGDVKDKEECVKGLKSAIGFIKRALAQRVSLRYIPDIMFQLDDSLEYGNHIDKLLKEIKDGKPL